MAVYIYIDNSNLWIEAKKHPIRKRSFMTNTKEDHRIRIEIGKLTEVVAAGRTVKEGFLYGSRPPPADTVWEKMRKQGFEVQVYDRSKVTGKEKKVDTKLVADVSVKACTTPKEERSTMVIITGDADMIPAIDVALQNEWNVEVAMWEHAMSNELKELARKGGRIKLRYLDDSFEKVTYTDRKCQISGNNHFIPLLKESGVVLTVHEKEFHQWHSPKDWYPDEKWCKKVEELAQYQFEYDWFNFTKSDDTRIFGLVLLFRKDGEKVFDSEKFMSKLCNDELATELYIIEAKKYRSYAQSTEKIVLEDSSVKEVFCLHEIETEGDACPLDKADDADKDDDGWQTVSHRKKKKR